MKGRVLSFSVQTGNGEISGDDGNRYAFVGEAWQEDQPPLRGMYVDFAVTAEGQATSIYVDLDYPLPMSGASPQPPQPAARRPGSKDKTVAGILGILLGGLGIHKFYLGYTGPAILFLLLFIFTCGIAGIITGIIGLIEGIIYLTKSDVEFDAIYVQGRKSFF
jgi:TM2 domain-containing membrane protein YozV